MTSVFTIAQDQERSKLAYSLQRRANIDLIYLTSISSKCTKKVQDVTFPLKFWTQHESDPAILSGQRLTAPVQFRFRVADDQNLEIISLECVLQADYELNEGYQPTVEEIEAFTESNAVFNCWPYFRELAQNTLTRMNYPPLAIPFLRLVPKTIAPPTQTVQPVQAELLDHEAPRMIEGLAPTRKRGRTRKGDD